MKILNRKEFLNTPEGTVYSYYEPCTFRELNIKTSDSESWSNDFIYFSLIGEFDTKDTEDFVNICEKMEQGKSIPASFEETRREGLFDDKQLFLVYEKDDIKRMIEVLQSTI